VTWPVQVSASARQLARRSRRSVSNEMVAARLWLALTRMAPKGAGGCYGSAGARYPLARPLHFYGIDLGSQGSLRSPGLGALTRPLLAATAAGGTMRGPASGQPPWRVFDVAGCKAPDALRPLYGLPRKGPVLGPATRVMA